LRGPGPRVARPAREHEAVDDERVLAGLEQLGEPDLAAARAGLLEAVVLGDDATRRQRAPLCRDALDRAPQLDLGLEEPVALAAVVLGLAGEANAGIHAHRSRV